MAYPLLEFPAKTLRARVISAYVREAGYRGVIAFSCGNAAAALRRELQGTPETRALTAWMTVIEVGPKGKLNANEWLTPAEIHCLAPDLLDATSGHLPMHLLVEIAKAFRNYFAECDKKIAGGYRVATGSGETVFCLRLAYPDVEFIPEYNVAGKEQATQRDEEAPMNMVVDALFPVVIR